MIRSDFTLQQNLEIHKKMGMTDEQLEAYERQEREVCHVNRLLYVFSQARENRPFPSSLLPLFQSESKCETIVMKMTLICMKMKLYAELEAQGNSEMAC